jgi:hypothetical protein
MAADEPFRDLMKRERFRALERAWFHAMAAESEARARAAKDRARERLSAAIRAERPPGSRETP